MNNIFWTNIFRTIKTKGKLLTTLLVLEILLEIGLTTYIPTWKLHFYDIIQLKKVDDLSGILWQFLFLISSMVLVMSYKEFLRSRLSQILRMDLSKSLFKLFKEKRSTIDHPEQRISDDSRKATQSYLQIGTEVLISTGIIITLIVKTWGSWQLMGAAFSYSAATFCVAIFFNKPLKNSDIELQMAEAYYRKNLTLAIHNSTDIDLNFKDQFNHITKKFFRYINVVTFFNIYTNGQNYLSMLIPLMILVPQYFVGTITFGEIMQGVSVFELISINSGVLLVLYPTLVGAQAAKHRIEEFIKR